MGRVVTRSGVVPKHADYPSAVEAEITLRQPSLAAIAHLPPGERIARVRAARERRRAALLASLPRSVCVLDPTTPTVRASLRALQTIAGLRGVESVVVVTRAARGDHGRRGEERWFTVVAEVVVDVEGQPTERASVERTITVVRARTEEEARRSFRTDYRRHARAYLNADGCFVNWRLVDISEVYDPLVTGFDARTVEVYAESIEPRAIGSLDRRRGH